MISTMAICQNKQCKWLPQGSMPALVAPCWKQNNFRIILSHSRYFWTARAEYLRLPMDCAIRYCTYQVNMLGASGSLWWPHPVGACVGMKVSVSTVLCMNSQREHRHNLHDNTTLLSKTLSHASTISQGKEQRYSSIWEVSLAIGKVEPTSNWLDPYRLQHWVFRDIDEWTKDIYWIIPRQNRWFGNWPVEENRCSTAELYAASRGDWFSRPGGGHRRWGLGNPSFGWRGRDGRSYGDSRKQQQFHWGIEYRSTRRIRNDKPSLMRRCNNPQQGCKNWLSILPDK